MSVGDPEPDGRTEGVPHEPTGGTKVPASAFLLDARGDLGRYRAPLKGVGLDMALAGLELV